MKRILLFILLLIGLAGCATLSVQPCGEELARPYFFEKGENLVAFRMMLQAKEQQIEAILQIKKIAEETYDITVFSTAGAYRMLQVTLTREEAKYSFLVPSADHAVVRIKAERFFKLLLFPSQSIGKCNIKKGQRQVAYKHSPMVYTYDMEEDYPQRLTGPKSFGKVYLTFEDYEPYEDTQLPHQLHYKDGKIQADLTLLRLKK